MKLTEEYIDRIAEEYRIRMNKQETLKGKSLIPFHAYLTLREYQDKKCLGLSVVLV